MIKKLLPVFVLIALIFPLANLFSQKEKGSVLDHEKIKDPSLEKMAPILEQKCSDCHSSKTKMPFYAEFPIAKQTITADIKKGLEHFDMQKDIFVATKVSRKTIAKLERVILDGSMPPFRYLALHWNASLSASDKEAIQAWINSQRVKHYASAHSAKKFKAEVIQPLPYAEDLDLNNSKVSLGDRLYHDTHLSGDNSVSCASCHDLKKGGTDQIKFSIGIKGQEGHINSPTVYNSGFNFVQFWNGRAANLARQARGPVANPIEMGANWDEVVSKLKRITGYEREFNFIYRDGLTVDTIVDAIAEFESSLVTPDSRFDQYLKGDEDAITADEKLGYKKFKEIGCASCHYGKAVGAKHYEKMGTEKDYFADRGGEISNEDLGRFAVTNDEADKFKFKVPSLRNIAVTYPYFHDGSVESLEDAVKKMAKYQLGKSISGKDTDLIVKFLKTLTGKYQGEYLD